jgi:hypothetical protein
LESSAAGDRAAIHSNIIGTTSIAAAYPIIVCVLNGEVPCATWETKFMKIQGSFACICRTDVNSSCSALAGDNPRRLCGIIIGCDLDLHVQPTVRTGGGGGGRNDTTSNVIYSCQETAEWKCLGIIYYCVPDLSRSP